MIGGSPQTTAPWPVGAERPALNVTDRRREETHRHRRSAFPAGGRPYHEGVRSSRGESPEQEPGSPGAVVPEGATGAPPGHPPARSPRSARILGGGAEPDPRFTLANERTFLAWIRTALALLAGGVALEAFTADTFAEPVRTGLAVVLLLLSMLLAVAAGVRWLVVERAMRREAPLPLSLLVPVLAAGAALVAAAFLAVALTGA